MGCPSEVEIGDNLVFSITTHDPDTGVLTDAAAAPAYRVYEDETATPILTGTMAKLDDANTTGFYTELIACTSGNGFENGKTYTIYIEATVDSDKGGICYGFKATSKLTALKADTAATLVDTGTDGVKIAAGALASAGIAASAANKIADHVLRRTFANAVASGDGDAKSFRSLLGAEAKLVNKLSRSGNLLYVTEEDDATVLGTQAISADADADPITGLDTV